MRLYFTVRSIPELASLPPTKREEVWQRSHRAAWRHWQTWLAFFVCTALEAAGLYFLVFAHPSASFSWGNALLGGSLLVTGSGAFFPIHATMVRPYLREALTQ